MEPYPSAGAPSSPVEAERMQAYSSWVRAWPCRSIYWPMSPMMSTTAADPSPLSSPASTAARARTPQSM